MNPTCHPGRPDATIGAVSDSTTTRDPRTVPDTTDGDHERFAHYVKKDEILRANIEGVEVEALCGKRWIPNRDPSRYPVCPSCKEILAQLRSGS